MFQTSMLFDVFVGSFRTLSKKSKVINTPVLPQPAEQCTNKGGCVIEAFVFLKFSGQTSPAYDMASFSLPDRRSEG